MYKAIKRFWCFILIIGFAFSLCSCAEPKFSSTEFAMNTIVTLTVYGDNGDEAMKAAFEEVRRIEKTFSAYVKDSELSKINSLGANEEAELSDEAAYVIGAALDMCRKTNGAYDISIKPLADLWDIKGENPTVPTDESIKAALNLVNYQNIILNGNKLSFAREGMKIDLGGAVKGYAADRVKEILLTYGVKNALIDLGGNIYAMGKNEQGLPWSIGLQNPDAMRGEPFSVESLSGKSAVTSGSYERYFEKDGVIYHHIFSPKTGYSADAGLISVSVIGNSSFQADMLSTAIFVMGADAFNKLDADFDYEKFITVDKQNVPRTYYKN